MKMKCILEPPGCITVRAGDFGKTIVKGDVVEMDDTMPGVKTTWGEALAGHERAFEPVEKATTRKAAVVAGGE